MAPKPSWTSWLVCVGQLAHALPSPGRIQRAWHRRKILRMLPQDAVGVEVGVHRGDFSAELLAVTKPRRLHLIDPWKHETDELYRAAWYGGTVAGGQQEMDSRYQGVVTRFTREMHQGVVQVHRSTARSVFGSGADASVDWVYIDGNHLYEFVRDDLELFARVVRPGGIIAGDDYTEGGWWQGGVKKAVDEFLRDRKSAFRLVGCFGDQFAIAKERV